MRHSKAGFAGTQHELQKWTWLIWRVVVAIDNPEARSALEEDLKEGRDRDLENLVGAINQILEGARDEDVLCKNLDLNDSMIVMEILRQLGDRAFPFLRERLTY